jgi:thiamine biosynthesis lipoprotein
MKRARLIFVAVLALAAACLSAQQRPRLFTVTRPAMGASFTIHLYAADERAAAALLEMAFEEVERLEDMLSNYRPSSELSRINRQAAHAPVVTDPEMFSFLETALDFSRRSDGAFDITVGPLARAWGFFRGQGRRPSREELALARRDVGWRKVQLDPRQRAVRFLAPGVQLDPGGIGKGYAVDRVIALLREAGVQAALVDAASSTIAALGAPPGEPGWLVQVPHPGDRARSVSTVLLRDSALSTSGSSAQFFRAGRRTYSHIFDPRTGRPVQGMLQDTVVAPSATPADALSTALFVLGPEKGKKLLQGVSGARALWMTGQPHAPRLFTWNWTSPAALSASAPPRPAATAIPDSTARRHHP